MPEAFNLASAEVKTERRIRLCFNYALAVGAYSTALYTIACPGGEATAPTVVAVYTVAGSPGVAELVLGADLVAGVAYTATAAAATPSSAAGFLMFDRTVSFRQGVLRQTPVQSAAPIDDALAMLYGEDIVWNGQDFVEAANGDLATTSSVENVLDAVARRQLANGLPWDDDYGAKLRGFVDGSRYSIPDALGSIVAQALADDRVKRAAAQLEDQSISAPEQAVIKLDITLVGDLQGTVDVPLKTS